MVFTGIVEEIGVVLSVEKAAELKLWDGSTRPGFVLAIAARTMLDGCYVGASIAVNGVCLTVTEFDTPSESDADAKGSFAVSLAPETLRRTDLGDLRAGARVNLERAAPVGGRNSGHYVQGHVDGTGEVVARWAEGDSLWFKVRAPRSVMRGVVAKGFIAVDVTSLTVCAVRADDGGDPGGAEPAADGTKGGSAGGGGLAIDTDPSPRAGNRMRTRTNSIGLAEDGTEVEIPEPVLRSPLARAARAQVEIEEELEEERLSLGGRSPRVSPAASPARPSKGGDGQGGGQGAGFGWFTFMLVPHTQRHVVLPDRAAGARVNLEVDVLGKYVAKSLEGLTARVDGLEGAVQRACGGLASRVASLEAVLARLLAGAEHAALNGTGEK